MKDNTESGSDTESDKKEPRWWIGALRPVANGAVIAAVVWAVFWLIFRGTAAAVANVIASNAASKLALVGTGVLVVGFNLIAAAPVKLDDNTDNRGYGYGYRSRDRLRQQKTDRRLVWFSVVTLTVTVVLAIVTASIGGYVSGRALNEAAKTTESGLPTYEWRTPFDVAADAVSQRAEIGVGNFSSEDTTYLPEERAWSTPVVGRGFAAGFTKIVIQHEGTTDTESCDFDGDAPRPGGFMSSNLRRQVALIDGTLVVNHDDIWGYCDGKTAKLVVPVTHMVGGLQRHPVPAGVVVFDGGNGKLHANVDAGELPGPVYPMSLAAAQRNALTSSASFIDKMFNRAGYELSQDRYDTGKGGSDSEGSVEAELNNSEFLLGHAKGDGYDFVSPLTSRSNSERITAVSVVEANHVRAGELNELVVHKLGKNSQRGNADQVEAVRANFPNLGWETGVAVAEIVPTADGTWEATLRNGGVVAKRVRIEGDDMCLLRTNGDELDCTTVNTDDAADGATGTTDDDGNTGEPTDGAAVNTKVSEMSDEELATLLEDIAAELRKRQGN